MTEYNSFEDKKQHFDTWEIIDTPGDFNRMISEFKALKSSNNHVLFRGICEARYKLYTSLQRECFNRGIGPNDATGKSIVLKLLEQSRNNPKGQNYIPEYFAKLGIPLNDWMLLALLQHYGAPSPLLDFTKGFIPALYFMCLGITPRYSNREIDNYASIIYFKTVDVCSAHLIENLPKTCEEIYNQSNKKLSNYRERDEFVLNDLSFDNIMSNNRKIELIPSYKGINKIKHKGNNKWIANLPIANMNMTSQEGEFVCNISDSEPLENLMVSGNTKYLHCYNIKKSLYHYILDNYLKGSLDAMKAELFPSEYQAAKDIYFRTMANLF